MTVWTTDQYVCGFTQSLVMYSIVSKKYSHNCYIIIFSEFQSIIALKFSIIADILIDWKIIMLEVTQADTQKFNI